MTSINFTSPDNLKIIRDVLFEQINIDKTNTTNTNIVKNINLIFDQNLALFMSNGTFKKYGILDANKLFLSQVIIAVKKFYPNLNKRINITNEEPYKIEDIHASRKSNFERDLELKQFEFDSLLVTSKPTEPQFSDNIVQDKITSMELLIEEKINERENDESIKIKPSNDKPKKVTWKENEKSDEINIFDKLKKINSNYEEQQSLSLSDFQPEVVNKITNKNNSNNEPILPLIELVKIINNFDSRIDEIQASINKLTNFIEQKL
jgi:hypothetical protein